MKKIAVFFLCCLMVFSFSVVYADTVEYSENAQDVEPRAIGSGTAVFTRYSSLCGRLSMVCDTSTTADYIKADVDVYRLNSATGNYLKVKSETYTEYNTSTFDRREYIDVTQSGTYYCVVTFHDKVGTKYSSYGPKATSTVGL